MSPVRPGAFVYLSILLTASLARPAPLDLGAVSDRLPYELVLPERRKADSDISTARRVLVADFDRDGFDEAIEATRTGLLAVDYTGGRHVNDWQFNVPVEFQQRHPVVVLGETADVTGDGFPEAVFIACGAPSADDALMVYDVERSELVASHPLCHGDDRNGDGRWDGRHTVTGIVYLPDPAAVVMREVGFDIHGRGVFAIDLRTGERVWEYLIAGNPVPTDADVLDLDGDGGMEVVFGNSSPDNMGDLEFDGEKDVVSRLHVLEADGSVRWTRMLGGVFCGPQLDYVDIDGDGASEIVSVSRTHRSGARDRLSVWRAADGEMIAQTPITEAVAGLAASRSSDGESVIICVAFMETGIQQYRLKDGTLGLGRSAASSGGIESLHGLDVFPEPGEEFVVRTNLGHVLVLGEDLDPLARFDDYPLTVERVGMMHADTRGDPMLVLEGTGLMIYEWRARPFEPADLLGVGGGAAALVLVVSSVAVFARRKRRPGASAFPVRDIHARLLRELAQASHDRLGVTRGLDRLASQLEYLSTDLGRTPELLVRTRATWSEFEEVGRSRLDEILTLCEAGDLSTEARKQAMAGLDGAHRKLADLFRSDLSAAGIRVALPGVATDIAGLEAALQRLRRQVESHFVSDAGRILRRVLLLREDELTRGDVVLDASLPDEGACAVRIDPVDLRFVVDNLVGNALRAMEGGDVRRLRVSATCGDDSVEIEFADTGCGIPGEHRDRIFSSGFSGRRGGGLGLSRSREMLEECGGELLLTGSGPGEGSTFLLRLRQSRAGVDEEGTA